VSPVGRKRIRVAAGALGVVAAVVAILALGDGFV
jgi:hypothetical protein